MDFMEDSDEEPPPCRLDPIQSLEQGKFSNPIPCKPQLPSSEDKAWTATKSTSPKLVPILKHPGETPWATEATGQDRATKTKSLQQIITTNSKKDHTVRWVDGGTEDEPNDVKRLRVSPGSSDSTSDAMDVCDNQQATPIQTPMTTSDWKTRPGVCDPNKVANTEPDINFIIRNLLTANLIGLGDKLQFHWVTGEVLAEGWLTQDGILCHRCGGIVSCAEFAKCAGQQVQNPSAHICIIPRGQTGTWMSLHDLELTLYNLSSVGDVSEKQEANKLLRIPADAAAQVPPVGEGEPYDITLDMLFN